VILAAFLLGVHSRGFVGLLSAFNSISARLNLADGPNQMNRTDFISEMHLRDFSLLSFVPLAQFCSSMLQRQPAAPASGVGANLEFSRKKAMAIQTPVSLVAALFLVTGLPMELR
jgi:hypothetical protein